MPTIRACLTVLAAAATATGVLSAQRAPAWTDFVVLHHADTITVERFTRDGTTLVGELARLDQHVRYEARLRPDGSIEHFEFTGVNNDRLISGSLDFTATRIRGWKRGLRGNSMNADSIDIPTPALPMPGLAGSWALAEQSARAAHAEFGRSVSLVGYDVASNGRGGTVTISRLGRDSILIGSMAGDARFEVSDDGSITGGTIPFTGNRLVRRPGAAAPLRSRPSEPVRAVAGAPAPVAPPASTGAHGTVVADTLVSPALGVRKQVIVYLPPSYSREPQRRYPVAYYLHGLGGSEMQWTRDILLHLVMDSLVNAGVPEMIVVMPDGDNGWYTSWAAPADYEACRIEEADSARADAFCVRTGRYDDYVAHDLVRFVDGKYRTQASRAHRAVGGLSMGGYGAMALAFEYPETFAAAASHSGALSLLYTGPHPFEGTPYWRKDRGPFDPEFIGWQALAFGPDTASWWARDPVRRLDLMLAKNGPNARGAVPALFADVGTEDGIADQSRVFKWALEKRGIPITYHEWPGRHDFAYWRAHVGESLSWIAARIGTKD